MCYTMNMVKTLKGGSFNLEFGRNEDVVLGEVQRLLNKHDLDFLAVQEASDYRHVLRKGLNGYKYYTWFDGGRGADENGVVVRDGIAVDKFKGAFLGDGWTTIARDHHVASVQNHVRIDGWLYVRGLHLPTPTHWVNGKLEAPAERKDDFIASVTALKRYLRWPGVVNARIAVGDWNESPTTTGEYSPNWLLTKTGAKAYTPTSSAGHGHIDWVAAKGCTIPHIFKDLDIREGSDHEPVVFVIKKN